MPLVLRWGRSAYETDLDLSLERDEANRLGLDWLLRPDLDPPDELERTDVLVVNSKVRVDPDILARLRGDIVITTTSGYDHIDVSAARSLGKTVARSPLARRDAVVETTLAGLYGLFREVPRLHAASERGHWARGDLPQLRPSLLAEATVVVVGSAGVIGSEVTRRLSALGIETIGVDPRTNGTELAEVLPRAHALTLHCHLTEATRDLVDAAALDRLPPGAVLVNTARGPILDVGAAVDRVRTGHLRGILVDVFPTEPWPDLETQARVPGVRFLPHAAGYTPDLGRRVAREVTAALEAWIAGDPVPHTI